MSKFIKNNSTHSHVRKLVYNRNYENTLLERLDRNQPINLRIGTRGDLERVTQAIERIEFRQLRQENEIHEIREERERILTTIEQLSRFINHLIVIPGRSRHLKLYMNQ